MSSIKVTNLQHASAASPAIVLDSSGNIAVQAGTAGAPAIQANGDSNTGIYFPAADNIGFTTGGTIRGRWTTDGLCFNADTAAANALDDYEEGTWTPSVGGNATYTVQNGKYTKIGNTVYIEGHLQIATLGTGSTTTMSGLPFAAGATVEGGLTVTYFSSLAVNVISLVLGVDANSTNTTAYSRTTAGTGSASVAIYGNSARIFFYGHYFI